MQQAISGDGPEQSKDVSGTLGGQSWETAAAAADLINAVIVAASWLKGLKHTLCMREPQVPSLALHGTLPRSKPHTPITRGKMII